MKIPEFEGLFDMHSEYLLPGICIIKSVCSYLVADWLAPVSYKQKLWKNIKCAYRVLIVKHRFHIKRF